MPIRPVLERLRQENDQLKISHQKTTTEADSWESIITPLSRKGSE